ncbi:HAD family phosphatase [Desulfobotulus sp. H1]|uniref:phosphoglycolate phosphatase n=1 Tax=Desulfobotulus pelophilus TaxID=2823377 RepID=A0ABT3N986_9BACT|nr:HAD family phosphatase [Desulfobotulus pelophilus]MCW7753572.1 HAD family phosphatase [Desulfobotulus pelophilus]
MEKTRIQTLLLDNDGVLVDTEKCYFEANRRVLAEYDITMNLEDYQEHFLRSSRGIHAWFPEMSASFMSDFREKRNKHHMELLAKEPITIPGVDKVLADFSSRFRIGVVTSSEKKPFLRIHERTGFLPFFDFVVCREDVRFSKPHPEPYLKALTMAGCPAEFCLVIEDARRGVMAAQAAGLCCWVVPGPMGCGGDLSGAERVLHSLEEARSLLMDV